MKRLLIILFAILICAAPAFALPIPFPWGKIPGDPNNSPTLMGAIAKYVATYAVSISSSDPCYARDLNGTIDANSIKVNIPCSGYTITGTIDPCLDGTYCYYGKYGDYNEYRTGDGRCTLWQTRPVFPVYHIAIVADRDIGGTFKYWTANNAPTTTWSALNGATGGTVTCVAEVSYSGPVSIDSSGLIKAGSPPTVYTYIAQLIANYYSKSVMDVNLSYKFDSNNFTSADISAAGGATANDVNATFVKIKPTIVQLTSISVSKANDGYIYTNLNATSDVNISIPDANTAMLNTTFYIIDANNTWKMSFLVDPNTTIFDATANLLLTKGHGAGIGAGRGEMRGRYTEPNMLTVVYDGDANAV